MRKVKKKVLIYINNLYSFDEFYRIVINRLNSENVKVYLLIEANKYNDDYLNIIKSLQNKNIIFKYWYLEIIGKNKIKNYKNVRFLVQNLDTVDIFLTTTLSFPELLILSKKISNKHSKTIIYINDMLPEGIWNEYKGTKITLFKKVLNLNKQPLKVITSKIKISLKTRILHIKKKLIYAYEIFLGRYILPLIYFKKIIKLNTKYNFLIDNSFPYIVSSIEEHKAIKKVFPKLNVTFSKPPYYLASNKNIGTNLMVLVPGPFTHSQLMLYSNEFIKIIKKVINEIKPPIIYFRFHPRQENQLKLDIISLFDEFKKNYKIIIQINSKDSLLETIPKCLYVIGNSSNALRVSRLSNRKINVIGVLNAFYVNGLWGENILLSGTECIKWVQTSNEIDFKDFNSNYYFKNYKNAKSYADILLNSLDN